MKKFYLIAVFAFAAAACYSQEKQPIAQQPQTIQAVTAETKTDSVSIGKKSTSKNSKKRKSRSARTLKECSRMKS